MVITNQNIKLLELGQKTARYSSKTTIIRTVSLNDPGLCENDHKILQYDLFILQNYYHHNRKSIEEPIILFVLYIIYIYILGGKHKYVV